MHVRWLVFFFIVIIIVNFILIIERIQESDSMKTGNSILTGRKNDQNKTKQQTNNLAHKQTKPKQQEGQQDLYIGFVWI